jgi:hypothetical protein
MAISNPLNGMRKAGTVGKPFSGVQVSQVNRKELMFIDTFFFFFLDFLISNISVFVIGQDSGRRSEWRWS